MTKVNMRIKVDKKLMKDAEIIYNQYGLDAKTVIKAYFKKIIKVGGIPFSIDKKDNVEMTNVVKEETTLKTNIKPNYINITMDKNDKDNLKNILTNLDLSNYNTIKLLFNKSINNDDIPFNIGKDEPNEELKASIKEGRENCKDKNRVRYNNVNEMLKALMDD